ncbi:xenobiotic acyltransferase family protein [Thermococcus pacificus]|uniref:Acetyltransferase n=1 Tax=Thermococcus pacificus TaxID=71998 RepID=A0A218P6H7_9EURY|nr:CatB-related O-acetyltransferase [Thermococcus pacificus]ASJ06388.1 hypothetical protein A3L08_03090 [Thermococcus pacificus]
MSVKRFLKGLSAVVPYLIVKRSILIPPIYIDKVTVGKNVLIMQNTHIKNSTIADYVKIYANNTIWYSRIGEFSYINKNSTVVLAKIGRFCAIGPGVVIGAIKHTSNKISQYPAEMSKDLLVEVGSDVWIGANAVIMPGVRIGNGAIIGAGAVVTRDVPDYAIAVGVPAKIKKYRFTEEIIEKLKEIEWWNFPVEYLKNPEVRKVLFSDPTPENLKKLEEIKADIITTKKVDKYE